MKVFDVQTTSIIPQYHSYCVVASDMATAERLVKLELPPGVDIAEIRLHGDDILIDFSAFAPIAAGASGYDVEPEKVLVKFELLAEGIKVQAVKELREILKLDLREAKKVIVDGAALRLSTSDYNNTKKRMHQYCTISLCDDHDGPVIEP